MSVDRMTPPGADEAVITQLWLAFSGFAGVCAAAFALLWNETRRLWTAISARDTSMHATEIESLKTFATKEDVHAVQRLLESMRDDQLRRTELVQRLHGENLRRIEDIKNEVDYLVGDKRGDRDRG